MCGFPKLLVDFQLLPSRWRESGHKHFRLSLLLPCATVRLRAGSLK